MEFLQKAYVQLTDVVKAMTPTARLVTALVAVVVVLSLGYLFNQQLSGPDAFLMGGESFSASQLRDMQQAFGKAGLEGYEIVGGKVKVPASQQSKFVAALAEANALPVEFGEYMKRAATANNFLIPRAQQELAARVARQQDLQNIIESLDGVERCAVQIDERVSKGFQEKSVVTASINIVPRGRQFLDDSRVAIIRSLVASSWLGLKPEAVTVVDLKAPKFFPGTGGGETPGGASAGDYADRKKRLEQDWQDKITRMLVPGIPGVLVTTNVELDADVAAEERPENYEPGPEGGSRRAAPAPHKHLAREGRVPQRVSVSVAVPNTYYEECWRKISRVEAGSNRRPTAAALAEIEASEKKHIEAAIAPLLIGNDPAKGAASQIAVTTFYPSVEPTPSEPTFEANAIHWLAQNWRTLGAGTLALACLLLVRSTVRAVAAGPSRSASGGRAASGAFAMTMTDAAEHEPRPPHAARPSPRSTAARDELAEIVRSDPEAAVGILRTWIGSTGK